MPRQKIVCDLNRLWDGLHPEPWLIDASHRIQEESLSLWQDVAAVGISRLYQFPKDTARTTSHPLERVRGWFHTLPKEIKIHTEIVASEKATAMLWELKQIKRRLDADPSANVSIVVDWMINRDNLQAVLAVIATKKDILGKQLQASLRRLDVPPVVRSDIWNLLPLRQVGTELSNRLNAVSRLHHEDWWGKLVL